MDIWCASPPRRPPAPPPARAARHGLIPRVTSRCRFLDHEAEPTDRSAVDTVIDTVREEKERLEALEEEIMSTVGPEDPRLEAIYDKLERMDPSTFEKRAGELLFGLGFSQAMMKRAAMQTWGGWRGVSGASSPHRLRIGARPRTCRAGGACGWRWRRHCSWSFQCGCSCAGAPADCGRIGKMGYMDRGPKAARIFL